MSDNIPQVVLGDAHPSWEWLRSVSIVLKSKVNLPTRIFLYWYEKIMCLVSMFTYSSTLSLLSYSLCIHISVYTYIFVLFSFWVVSHSFRDPMDCSMPGSSVYGDLQTRTLEWVDISSSRGSSCPRDWTRISCIGRWALYHWTTWKAPYIYYIHNINVIFLEYELVFHLCITQKKSI